MSATLALSLLYSLVGCKEDPEPTTPVETSDTSDGALHEPLAMPAVPTLDPADFAAADTCEGCHSQHVAEWRTSMHAYAMVDPVFQALTEVRQSDLSGTEDQFCTQCHSAIGTRGGEIVPGFSFDALSPIVMEGITCTSCHSVTEVVRDYNSGHTLDPKAPMQGPLSDPVETEAHASAYNPELEGSLFCGGCHDVIETSGLDLERPYREWTQSPSAQQDQQCQGCHMPEIERPAADGGPARTTHEHRWVGVDVPLVDGWMTPEQEQSLRDRIGELLAGAASLSLSAPSGPAPDGTLDVTITLENLIPAHNLPTGSTFLRQVWLELTATDSVGTVLYQTGQLDANGDLEDYWSEIDPFGDPDLITLSSGFVDEHSARTLFPWRAAEHSTGALPPGYQRTYTLFVPTEGAVGPVHVEARLRFRALPPYLLRLLGFADKVDRIEIHDLAEHAIDVTL